MNNLQKAIKGLVVMSEDLEEVFKAFINNQVSSRQHYLKSHLRCSSLGARDVVVPVVSFFEEPRQLGSRFRAAPRFHMRKYHFNAPVKNFKTCLQIWIQYFQPPSYWLSGFYFTQGFLTGNLQTHARKYDLPIDQLKYEFIIQPYYVDQEFIKLKHDEESREVVEAYGSVKVPKDGVIVHGIFLDAGRWDIKNMVLVDPNPGEINPAMPAILLLPVTTMKENDTRYICPLYKTSIRAGTLSTTGHSTNFVVALLLPSKENQSYWILKGTASLTQITD